MKRGKVFSANNYFERYFQVRDQNTVRDGELSELTAGDRPASVEPCWFDPRRHPLPPGPRPPVFRLLEATEGLELPADRRPLRLAFQAEPSGPSSRTASRWLDGGSVPLDREEAINSLVGMACLALAPLDPKLPLRIDASQASKASRRRAQRWCELLQVNHPVHWITAGDSALDKAAHGHRPECWRPEPSIRQEAESWRCASAAIARNRSLQATLQDHPGRHAVAIALPSRKAGRGRAGRFEKQLRPLLKTLALEQQIPLLRLRSLSLQQQIRQLRRYRWIVGPFQPAMLLVHLLGEAPQPAPTLILLSRGSRRSRQVMRRIQRVQRQPHRLLILPPATPATAGKAGVAGDDDRRVLADLIRWLQASPDPHSGHQSGALQRG